jgi:pimeloyl-ACP methyl ester carboxylesterase
MTPRFRQIIITTAVILIVILLAGATYQGVATALERRKYPHPGSLIDVGGHQLHIYCTGEGSPAVVLEASASGMSAAWGLVQPRIAQVTQVCSYDRAGLGWSEAGDRPYDPGRVPDELHALLRAAGVPPPYVLSGHSLGASFMRMFANRYAGEVAALVEIDPAVAIGDEPPLLPLSPWLARAGLLRATRLSSAAADGLPEPSLGALSSFLNRPDHLTRAAREIARWNETVELGANAEVASVRVATLSTTELRDQDAAHFTVQSPFLNDPASAKRAVAGIAAAVTQTRQKMKKPEPKVGPGKAERTSRH